MTFRKRDHEVALRKADVALDAPFLVPLARRAVAALEQVMTAEGHEGGLLLPIVPLQDAQNRRLQVVVGDAAGHRAEEMEGLDVALEEGLLLLERERHDEAGMRVIQAHDEQLHDPPLAAQLDHRGAPIYLGVLARVELEGQVDFLDQALPPLLGDVTADRDLAALIPRLAQRLVDLARRVALLARHTLAFGPQRVDLLFPGS